MTHRCSSLKAPLTESTVDLEQKLCLETFKFKATLANDEASTSEDQQDAASPFRKAMIVVGWNRYKSSAARYLNLDAINYDNQSDKLKLLHILHQDSMAPRQCSQSCHMATDMTWSSLLEDVSILPVSSLLAKTLNAG